MDRRHRFAKEEDIERVAPHLEESLWEVPCKACIFLGKVNKSSSNYNIALSSGTRNALSSKSCRDQ